MMAKFPQRLFQLLKLVDENGWEDTFSWVNNGTGFKVHDRSKFENVLLKKHFNTTRYASFARQLHAYGFDCVRTGRQTGIYSHPHFRRDDPEGSFALKREKGRNISKEAMVSRRCQEQQDEEGLDGRLAGLRNLILEDNAIVLCPSLLERPNARGLPNMKKNNSGMTDDGTHHSSVMSSLNDTVLVADRTKKSHTRIPSEATTQDLPFKRRESGFWSGTTSDGRVLMRDPSEIHCPDNSFCSLSTNHHRVVSDVSLSTKARATAGAASAYYPSRMDTVLDESKSNAVFANRSFIRDDYDDLDPIPLNHLDGMTPLKTPLEDHCLFHDNDWDATAWSPAGSVFDEDEDDFGSPDKVGSFLEPRPIDEMVENPASLSTPWM
ncbi:unnamed protein product [Cylindrotheca closterium]|uniref:HSF-type DNA-binding domain-containing protein n=1 Tax=Cylindrotheca closterium TaxID=2856 RepID=A0AAD2G3J1_9STRA|nr:unnamed protein product [Cylindrotheca closterium]